MASKNVASILTGVLMVTILHLKPATTIVHESELFPYVESEGNSRFFFGDDDFLEVPFRLPFNFFNKTYTSAFISGNGQISFGEGIRTYTPQCVSSTVPMIMTFWADANNIPDPQQTKLLYRETTSRPLLQKASKDVFKAFPHLQGITLSWMFIVTWKDVPFYGASSSCEGLLKRNTYQLVLATDGLHSFALMYYNKIMWTTGTSSSGSCSGTGGNPAKAGFDYGDGKTLYTIPGSCTNSIMNITDTSNINYPGKWVFRIDSNLDTASCKKFDETTKKVRLQPPIVSVMGNTPILIHGPCLEKGANVTCVFRDLSRPSPIEMKGSVLPGKSVTICPLPYLYSLGRIRVDLIVSYPNQLPSLYKGYLYVTKEDEDIGNSPQIYLNQTQDGSLVLSAKWDPTLLRMKDIEKLDLDVKGIRPGGTPDVVDITVVEYDGKRWNDVGTLSTSVKNNGYYEGSLNSTFTKKLKKKEKIPPRAFAVRGRRKLRSGDVLEKQQTASVFAGTAMLGGGLDFDNDNAKASAKKEKVANKFDTLCKQWFEEEPAPPNDTLPCPRTVEQASIDSRFAVDQNPNLPVFHPGAATSYIQSTPSPSGAGSQCAYDSQGNLMIGPPSGGRLHRRSPNSWMDHWGHFWDDVVPCLYCCKWSTFKKRNCRKYFYAKRPSDDGSKYAPPRPVRATGDPHITTFDGLTYTFNGVGEFWMVRHPPKGSEDEVLSTTTFTMQARMEQYISAEGIPSNASVFTAAVMEQFRHGSSVRVQVSYSSERIFVMVDDEPLDIYEDDEEENTGSMGLPNLLHHGFTLYHSGATIFLKSKDEVVISFSSGFSFKFTTTGPNEIALNIIGSASPNLMNSTEGLMANFDNSQANDLKLPNGTILEASSSMHDIHYGFGMHWVASENESIFWYPPGKSYTDFYKPDFEPTFLSSEDLLTVPENVVDLCNSQPDCIFDYITTGSESIANSTKEAVATFEETVAIVNLEVKHCDPPAEPTNGYLIFHSYILGSNMEVRCEDNYILHVDEGEHDHNFTCEESENGVGLRWVGINSEAEMPPKLACLTEAEVAEISRRKTVLIIGWIALVVTVTVISIVGIAFSVALKNRLK